MDSSPTHCITDGVAVDTAAACATPNSRPQIIRKRECCPGCCSGWMPSLAHQESRSVGTTRPPVPRSRGCLERANSKGVRSYRVSSCTSHALVSNSAPQDCTGRSITQEVHRHTHTQESHAHDSLQQLNVMNKPSGKCRLNSYSALFCHKLCSCSEQDCSRHTTQRLSVAGHSSTPHTTPLASWPLVVCSRQCA